MESRGHDQSQKGTLNESSAMRSQRPSAEELQEQNGDSQDFGEEGTDSYCLMSTGFQLGMIEFWRQMMVMVAK